jgi:hypothetical protein
MANPEHLEVLKSGVDEWNQWREAHSDIRPDLFEADLSGANLSRANLCVADLSMTILCEADLGEANLGRSYLREVNLLNANLSGADLSGARVIETTFANNDLSSVKGLNTVEHLGPSTIGIDTFYKSGGKIPDVFLRESGVPENFIVSLRELGLTLQ